MASDFDDPDCAKDASGRGRGRAGGYDWTGRKTLEYINENLTKDISAQDIADALNVSRSYLSHMFKKSTGYGLWNYVITKRLVYAQKLLFGGSSVTEACYESGFKDYAHFIKSFTKTFGCSPKQCKKVETDSYMMKLNL